MSSQAPEFDNDNTVIVMRSISELSGNSLPFTTVAKSHHPYCRAPYISPQVNEIDKHDPVLNPLVQAASRLFLEIVNLKRLGIATSLDSLRNRLEAEIRGFHAQALACTIPASQINAAQYLLCTALDEAVVSAVEERKFKRTRNGTGSANKIEESTGVSSGKNLSEEDWQGSSLLSTFHKDTWGGEIFFDVLARAMEQPAGRINLLELIYLLLSLGFEGKYRVQDRKGSLAVESLRDQIFRQIRLLRGAPSLDLAKKPLLTKFRDKTYIHIPSWLVIPILLFCLAITFGGFFNVLKGKAHTILNKYGQHTSVGKFYVLKGESMVQAANPIYGKQQSESTEKISASSPVSTPSIQ